MNRRAYLSHLPLLPFLGTELPAAFSGATTASKSIIKPKPLAAGDTIGLIAPASGTTPENIEKAIQQIMAMGFKVKVGKHCRENMHLFSSTEENRLADLHTAFLDPEVNGIWCLRGGDGAPRLLPMIDYKLIRKHPKVFIGYSDITALHLAFFRHAGLVTFHGPVGTSNYSDYTKKHVLAQLMAPSIPYINEFCTEQLTVTDELYQPYTIRSGIAEGRLIGGNLSLVAALAGTPFGISSLKNCILFLEDIYEPPYRVDRMLTQLQQSLDFSALAGIALGVFDKGHPDTNTKPTPNLKYFLEDQFKQLTCPIAYGLSFGHISNQFTLPYGIKARLNADDFTLTFLEKGVQ